MPVDLVRASGIVLAALAIGGCGSISSQRATTENGAGSALGQTIATAPTATATGSTPATRATPTSAAPPPESIHLPSPPSATAPRTRAILRVATQFANAYLLYQVGRDPRPVQQVIRQTCTPAFAQLLLSQPVNIPATRRRSVAGQPSAVVSATYTGPASLGPGPPLQIVIARYPIAVGQLTIELAASGEGWRVDSLR
jgi:hypothetical protein